MLRHHLKLTFRSLRKSRSTFLINLIGLSTGMACALLIYIWAMDELRMDRFHEKDHRLYQVLQNLPLPDEIRTIEATPGLLARTLAKEMPEVEYAAAVIPGNWFSDKGILSAGNKHIKARGQFVSEDYFRIFSWNIIEGNKEALLKDKYAVLLSDELAKKLFSTTDGIVGKTVEWQQGRFDGLYQVSGIFEKPSKYSSTQFDLVFNYELFFEKYAGNLKHWSNSNPATYLTLHQDADPGKFDQKVREFIKDKYKESGNTEYLEHIGTLMLQRYSDRYLYNQFENGVQAGGRIAYVRLFALIAIFLLAIACINFVNLSTARASVRAKEVGVKKVVGAQKRALVFQYLGEALLMAIFSLLVAFLMVELLLPQFNNIAGKALSLRFDWLLIAGALLITVITGLLAGLYPAFYLSALKPINVLKGELSTSARKVWIRKGLVVFQFAISVLLIVSVLVVYNQIKFIQAKNLGFDKDNLITFNRDEKLQDRLETFLAEMKKIPGVVNASSLSYNFTGEHGQTSGMDWEGKDPNNPIQFGALAVDYGLIEMLNIDVEAGRTFSREFGEEGKKIIFNDAAIAAMGIEEPVGKTVRLWGQDLQIIGVTRNFHIESLYEPVKPCFFYHLPNRRNVLVKIEAGREHATIEQVARLYKEFTQGLPFEYQFVDEEFRELYASEQRVATLSKYFAGMAILISCLGLFGLTVFAAERRRKEIGIRKILGATVAGIVALLSKEFIRLVGIAVLIAMPLAWYMAGRWLESFAYRIDIQWGVFALAGVLAISIAMLTVSFHSVKAAQANPADSLRNE